jgi:hypothetical protein
MEWISVPDRDWMQISLVPKPTICPRTPTTLDLILVYITHNHPQPEGSLSIPPTIGREVEDRMAAPYTIAAQLHFKELLQE